MNTELLETLDQLLNPKQSPQIRAAAATAAAGQTSGNAPENASLRRELGSTDLGKRVLRRLLALTSDTATARLVLSALVNIAEDDDASNALVDLNVVQRMCDALLDEEQRAFCSLHTAILSNVTRGISGRQALIKDEAALAQTRALLRKLNSLPNLLWVSNLASLPKGRELLFGDEPHLSSMLRFLMNKDASVRLAVATVLRNCALAVDCHADLLRADSVGYMLARFANRHRELDADELSLLPLVVREAYQKKDKLTPEPVEEVRTALAEALLLLCQSKEGRESLRTDGAYAVLKNHHLDEENAQVQESIEQIVDRTKLLDEEADDNSEKIVELPQEVEDIEAATSIE